MADAFDGRAATLQRDGETMRVSMRVAPAGVKFSSKVATPSLPAENQNEGITLLRLAWVADVSDAVIEIHLVPADLGETSARGALETWAA